MTIRELITDTIVLALLFALFCAFVWLTPDQLSGEADLDMAAQAEIDD